MKIEQEIKEKEPGWKIDRILDGQTSDPLHESIVFRAGKQQAEIEISIWKRLEDAQGAFEGEVAAFDNIRGKKAVKKSLPNLGEENYMWTNPGSDAWPMIYFRKGNIYASVFAPSVAIARRFAQHLFGQIPKVQ